jgi:hypothetical protein
MILGQTGARHRCAERAKPRTYTVPRLAPPDARREIPFWLPVLLPPRLRLLRGVDLRVVFLEEADTDTDTC